MALTAKYILRIQASIMNKPTVTLHVRYRTDEINEFGEQVDSWTEPESVEGCLFAPGAPKSVESSRPDSAMIDATAFFPQGFTKDLYNAQVSTDGENWLDVLGHPQRFPKLPRGAKWNLYVLLRGSEG